ncbi:hypothetical protein HID58_094550 [Brassica napus]|uniref:Uncharacterized protein n=1 Tax=Brassica napus TaxID=3708 RepID=A0ABQ7X6U0_BRANA|nr:hypothetical protein HID58_094550 [Brassica napus]
MAVVNSLRRLARTTQVTLQSRYAVSSQYMPGSRILTTEASPEKLGSKGHDMLAPFTAGWQSADLDPLIIAKSEGSYVYDDHGKKYLDSLAGLWCTALGGNEPRLVSAAVGQLNTLPFYHSFWNRTTKPSLDLAKDLLEMFTAKKMAKAFFTNSGSEANDTQVKLVWYYNNALGRPEKKKFIARKKSYHGSTLISASLSGLPALHQNFDLPAPFVLHTDCPHYWRFHLPGETEEEFSTRLAKNLEDLIIKEGPETVSNLRKLRSSFSNVDVGSSNLTQMSSYQIGAFIAEPVMGAGGVIPPPATYFEKIQAVVKKYDILFIADEVICAFGRLGTMFGCDKYNIKPDLVSLAKALSSAYMPIGAILMSQEVADVIYSQSNKLGAFSHGFTYSGHPVSCAVAIEALKIYKERNIPEHVAKVSPRFQDGLKAFAKSSPIIGEIRGTGLILGTEFTDNKSPNEPFPPEWGVGAYFGAECQKRGMLVRVAGDGIMMSPPLIISPEEIDELIDIYGKALKATEERVKELKAQQKK